MYASNKASTVLNPTDVVEVQMSNMFCYAFSGAYLKSVRNQLHISLDNVYLTFQCSINVGYISRQSIEFNYQKNHLCQFQSAEVILKAIEVVEVQMWTTCSIYCRAFSGEHLA